MLWTLFVILLVLWSLAVFSGHVLGGFIHVLLLIAIIVMLVRIFKGPKTKLPSALEKNINKGE